MKILKFLVFSGVFLITHQANSSGFKSFDENNASPELKTNFAFIFFIILFSSLSKSLYSFPLTIIFGFSLISLSKTF